MAVSNIRWRMKGQWQEVMDRAAAFAPDIPDTGISRSEFERVALMDVDPRDVDEVLSALHRRKVIYVSRNRGAVMVYGAKPPSRDKPEWAVSTSSIGAFVAVVASHVLAALNASDDYWRDVSCGRVVRLAAAHEAKGLPLPEIRTALWQLFPAEIMNRVAWHEPRLQQGSTATEFQRLESPPRRIARGLALPEKLLAMVDKAGRQGTTPTALNKGLRPEERKQGIAAILASHEAKGLIVSAKMRIAERGRPGLRFFSVKHGLPFVDSRGLAHFL